MREIARIPAADFLHEWFCGGVLATRHSVNGPAIYLSDACTCRMAMTERRKMSFVILFGIPALNEPDEEIVPWRSMRYFLAEQGVSPAQARLAAYALYGMKLLLKACPDIIYDRCPEDFPF